MTFNEPHLGLLLEKSDDPTQLPEVAAVPRGMVLPAAGHFVSEVNGEALLGAPDTYEKAARIITSAGRPIMIRFQQKRPGSGTAAGEPKSSRGRILWLYAVPLIGALLAPGIVAFAGACGSIDERLHVMRSACHAWTLTDVQLLRADTTFMGPVPGPSANDIDGGGEPPYLNDSEDPFLKDEGAWTLHASDWGTSASDEPDVPSFCIGENVECE